MRAKNLALRVLSTAAMLSIVTSIAAPAFAATYYINDGSVDVKVSDAGIVTVEQSGKTYKDGLDSVVIRGGTRSEGETDDRIEADASPATQEADGSNAPAGNETEAPKSENTAGDTAPKQETTAAGERKEGTPQQEPTEEEEEEEEQQEPTEEKVTPEQKPTEKEAEEKVTPQPAKAKTEAPKATQKPSAEQEEEQEEQEEEQQEEEDEPTVPAAPAKPTENVITIVNNFVKKAEQAFSFVLDNVNIDRSGDNYGHGKAALTVKGNGDTEIELDGDNILKGGSYHAALEKNDSDGTGTLTIKDEDGSKGSLLAVGNSDSAGIGGSSKGGNGNTSNITITGGNITAISGWYGAGIGGGECGYGKDITITGDAIVKASGYHGAGIGGGPGGGSSDGSGKVTISGHANVIAFSNAGAGIGGGASGCADVTISEDATVFAQGYNGGTGIGTGETANPNTSTSVGNRTSIRISDRANVTAISDNIGIGSTSWRDTQTQIEITGGTINIASRSSQYPVIGVTPNDDMTLTINGSTGNTVINAYTSANKDASIGKLDSNWQLSSDTDQIQYNEDGRSKFGENGSVILKLFKNALVKKSDNPNDQILCFDGSTALYKITSGELYDTLHNAQWWMKNHDYTSQLATDTTHAWKVDDTKERVEPTPDQEGHVYYKCSVPGCKAVHDEVLPKLEPESTPDPTPVQPDPTPVQPEPAPDPTPAQPDIPAVTPPSDNQNTTKPEPVPEQPDTPADNQNTAKDDVSTPKLYVIDLANTQVLFDETRQNDTVTYTTKQDGASLTGSFEALEAMAADDVKTIVFQTIGTNTPGAVSRVSVDALLQHGGETLLLTHNGTEVHLTIDGQNADSLLLQ